MIPHATLVEGLELIRDLGRKPVPDDAPTAFVKPCWYDHVWEEEKINRHYYEFYALAELRNGLRSGDLWVGGSRQLWLPWLHPFPDIWLMPFSCIFRNIISIQIMRENV